MKGRPQVRFLTDGQRLHLNHGPIDLIIKADGPEEEVRAAYAAAVARFETVLEELVAELPVLRSEVTAQDNGCTGPIARAMSRAVQPFWQQRVTPMAAVAGAVADHILRTLITGRRLSRAYVNNGGDIALHLAPGETFSIASPSGPVTVSNTVPSPRQWRGSCGAPGEVSCLPYGIATSGWRGRSFSLGIADAVTVLARSAAEADAAATLIANAIDLPGSAKITRQPAHEIAPDTDLKDRLVTIAVAPLTAEETETALARGLAFAQQCCGAGLINGAALLLNGVVKHLHLVPPPPLAGEVASGAAAPDDGEGFSLTRQSPLRRVPRHLFRKRERTTEQGLPHA